MALNNQNSSSQPLGNRKLPWEDARSVLLPRIDPRGCSKWLFDPRCPVDVRFYHYRGWPDIPVTHHDYFELFYVQAGRARFQVGDRRFPIASGDMVLVSNASPHRMLPSPGREVRVANLYFLRELIGTGEAPGADIEYLLPFRLSQSGAMPFVAGNTRIPAQVLDLMETIHGDLATASSLATLSARTSLKMILVLLGKYCAKQAGVTRAYEREERLAQRLAPVFDFAERHCEERIAVDDAAKILGLSRSGFMHLFRQATGQSFIQYLEVLRIAKAKALLMSTEESLSQVAQHAGFCDQSYLGAIFRRYTQMTPLQWRRTSHEAYAGPPRAQKDSADPVA